MLTFDSVFACLYSLLAHVLSVRLQYYSECHCEDCSMSLCTWCNIDVHEPIGKRNHYRPRMYEGGYPFMKAAVNGVNGAAEIAAAAGFNHAEPSHAEVEVSADSMLSQDEHNCQPSAVQRISVLTEATLQLSAGEAWSLLGCWDYSFLPFHTDLVDSGRSRVINLPASLLTGEESTELIGLQDILLEYDEAKLYYRYTRFSDDTELCPYDEHLSKFALVPQGEARCVLQWLTSAAPLDSSPEAAERATQAIKTEQQLLKHEIAKAVISYKGNA